MDQRAGIPERRTPFATFRIEGFLQPPPSVASVAGVAKTFARFGVKAGEDVYEITARADVAGRVASMPADTLVAVRGTIHLHQWKTAGFSSRHQVELQADTIYQIEAWPPI